MTDSERRLLHVAAQAVVNGDQLSALALADLAEEMGEQAVADDLRRGGPVRGAAVFEIKAPAKTLWCGDVDNPARKGWVDLTEQTVEVAVHLSRIVGEVINRARANGTQRARQGHVSAKVVGNRREKKKKTKGGVA